MFSAIGRVIKSTRRSEPSFKNVCNERFIKIDGEASERSGDDTDMLLSYGSLV